MQRELYVTSSRNFQFVDDVQSRAPKHLIFLIAQCLRRRNNDAVARMNADRVYIFHTTYGNTVSRSIAHHFIFDFLPSGDTAFHKNLSHAGKPQAVCQNLFQFNLIMCDTAAGTAKRIGGAQDDRITDFICEIDSVLNIFYYERGRAWLPDFFHRFFKFQTVFRFLNRLCGRTEKCYAMFGEKTCLIQFHTEIQARLSAHIRKQAVRFFFDNNLFQHLCCQRFNIHFIRNIAVRHNRRRIGINKNDFHSLFFQGTAGLCARIIKFRRLSDYDWTGTNNQYSFYIRIFRHLTPSSSSL